MSTFVDILNNLTVASDDQDIIRLIRFVSRNGLEPWEVASLANKIAEEGNSLPVSSNATADIPSTGGPSSLSTLICPLFLRSRGFTVPKLGVPGRPAGGIDVLATISGYETNLTCDEVLRCIAKCQYAHFLAGDYFVPLDARMFRIRQAIGEQQNPHLVAASLIAKKLAASVDHVLVDVRVGPHGNFGRTLEDARLNAKMFNTVARIAGRDSACYLSDATSVYQPYIGRGEALVALDDVFNGQCSNWLNEHVQECWDMTQALGVESRMPDRRAIKRAFVENLAAQGSSTEEFDLKVEAVRESNKTIVRATSPGHVQVDINKLRHQIASAQTDFAAEYDPFPDPCGVELLCRPGEWVEIDQPLAKVREVDTLKRTTRNLSIELDRVIYVSPDHELPPDSFGGFDSELVMGGIE